MAKLSTMGLPATTIRIGSAAAAASIETVTPKAIAVRGDSRSVDMNASTQAIASNITTALIIVWRRPRTRSKAQLSIGS